MCLGIPARVVKVEYPVAEVDFGDGVIRRVDISALDDVRPGDIVVVHAGIAIEKLREEELDSMAKGIQEFVEELKSKDVEELLREILGVRL